MITRAFKRWIQKMSATNPPKPAKSVFGADADHQRAEVERQQEWDRQIAIQKGRVRGM